MSEFIVTSNLPLRLDCNFLAKEIVNIKENSVIEKVSEVGAWLKVRYMDKVGWIYPFDKQSNFLLEENKPYEFKLGDLVVLKSSNNFVNDIYGKAIIVKQDNKKLYYKIVELLNNPKIIRIRSNIKDTEVYWVTSKMVSKVDMSNTSPPKNLGMFDTISNGLSSISTAFSNLFSLNSGNPAKTPTAGFDPRQVEILENSQVRGIIESWTGNTTTSDHGILGTINWSSAREYLSKFRLGNIRNVFGMPYQYMPIADMRFGTEDHAYHPTAVTGNVTHDATNIADLGVKYAEKIVGRMPLMIVVPGVADFMAGFSDDDRNAMLRQMVGSNDDSTVERFVNNFSTAMKGTRASFYNMYPAWVEYYKYVNPMCWVAAKFMGVGKYRLPGTDKPLEEVNWAHALKNEYLQNNAAYTGACAFYVQSDNQISESFSNGTTQPSIASKVNSVSDQGRELMFLSSSVDGMLETAVSGAKNVAQGITSVGQAASNTATAAVTNNAILKKFERSGGAFNAILDGINHTIAGSKMLFPDLWQDSQFTRNYSVKIKLDSPDNDPLSLYLNIVVPLIHLICLAAPRSMGPTTYASPFLVKAYYQGFFSVNMGLISELSISKGAEGAWTLRNVPTVVEVSMDIKDLFANNLTISKSQNLDLNIITNTPLLDYVGNLCGVNINEPDWTKIIILYKMLMKNRFYTGLDNLFDRVVSYINAGKQNIYQSVLAGNFNPFRVRS